MRIRSVHVNVRRQAFEIETSQRNLVFPFIKAAVPPTRTDPLRKLYVDWRSGKEGFLYYLSSGRSGRVDLFDVSQYDAWQRHERGIVVAQLLTEARRRVERSTLPKREIIRLLGTSASQFYRLLDEKGSPKSVEQLIDLLDALGCTVEVVVRDRDG